MTELTLQEIQAQATEILKTMDTSYRSSRPPSLHSRYHRAAAVLTAFTPDTLQPAPGPGAASRVDLDRVVKDSTAVGVTDPVPYALREEVRRDVLGELGTREAMLDAIQANPERPTDATQAMLEAYIQGNAPSLSAQSAKQVAGTFQVVQWLDGLVDGLPTHEAVQQRWDVLDLLRTFDVLAGVKFRGREAELSLLHTYVLEPSPDGSRRPSLLFHGPGGVGKSALVARFIQDLVELPSAEAVPWTYIDFDRPGIDPEEPLTIVIEALRQLGIQYPEQRQYVERFRKGLQDDLLQRIQVTREVSRPATKQAIIGKGERQEGWWSYLGHFADLLYSLGASQRPYLLALDTFEEVQYRSSTVVMRLFRFLQALQEKAPMTRPVLTGRNPVKVPEFAVENHELSRFQPEAAQALLEGEGIPPDLAQKIVRQVGASPLSLRLALDLWRRSQTDAEGISDFEGNDFLFEVQEGQIEGELFARILEHIHDDEVRQLAHPGLVLRRITPDIILKVLAKNCGVKVRGEAGAENLFDRLAREESLVNLEGRVLRHRPDVRIIMVRLLRNKEPEQVRKIEKAAVRYYSQRESPEERAEEIYHRLSLQQSLRLISNRWADAEKRGWTDQMRRFLFNAREELEPRERAWLADKLGFELTPEEEEQADQQTWEHEAESRARRFLEYNDPERALTEINKRPRWLPGSPLYLLALQAYEILGDWKAAADVAGRGIRSASEKGDRSLAVLLRLFGTRIDLQLSDFTAARRKLDSAETLVKGSRETISPLRLLEIDLYRLVMARQAGDAVGVAHAVDAVQERFTEIPDDLAQRDPALLGWLATELGPQQPKVMARVLRLIGLQSSRPEVENQLIVNLAQWDQRVTTEAGEAPGLLARQIGAAPDPSATPSQIWRGFLAATKPEESGRALSRLLEERSDVPEAVLTALGSSMALRAGDRAFSRAPVVEVGTRAVSKGSSTDERASVQTESKPPASFVVGGAQMRAGRVRPDGQRLTGRQTQQLCSALLSAFHSQDALAMMLSFRLDRRLETIDFSNNMADSVFNVVQVAEEQGWSLELLLAARATNPDNPELALFADTLGVGLISGDRAEQEALIAETSALSLDVWRSKLGRMETQVCRIEVKDRITGTGFLLGPDLVMTAADAIVDPDLGKVNLSVVTCRFDYQGFADSVAVSPGEVFQLDPDFLFLSSPVDGLGYALLRVASQAGYSTVGGPRVESTATLRNWIHYSSPSSDPQPGSLLVFLYYGVDGRLKGTIEREGIHGLDERGVRLTYPTKLDGAALGAPCFDAALNLVAVHLGQNHEEGFGVSMNAIAQDLQQHDYVLGSDQAVSL